jgi:hypothetical protein
MIADGTVLTVDLSDASVTSPKISFPVRAPNGAAAAPSYSFINATGAGLRWDAGASWFNIENPTGRLVLSAKLDPVLVSNGYDFDGTNWRSYDTAQASATATMSGSGGFAWYIAPATTGNLGWVNRMGLDASGNLTIGGSFEPTTNITLKNGAALIARTPDGVAHNLILMNNEVLFYNYAGTQYRWVNQPNSVELMKLTNAGALSIASTFNSGAATVTGLSTSARCWFSGSQAAAYTVANAPGGSSPFEIQMGGGGAAFIAFHRPGYYAAHFGLDTDNIWKVGGWSYGNASYRVLLGDSYGPNGGTTRFSAIQCDTYYVGDNQGSYYLNRSGANLQASNMNVLSWGWFGFNGNPGINWSWDGTYITSTHSIRSGGSVYMNGNNLYFANNGGIYLVWDGTNISSTHRFNAPNYTVGNGGSYQMIDTNVRIARPAGTNIMYIYAYDAQWAFIRTPDSVNVGYVDAGGFHSISKLKYKTNITPIQDGLKMVCDQRVTPISYSVMGVSDGVADIPSLGFAVEDMAEVVPNAVGYDEEGPASINYGSLVAVLWDAVRTLNTRIEELEKAA